MPKNRATAYTTVCKDGDFILFELEESAAGIRHVIVPCFVERDEKFDAFSTNLLRQKKKTFAMMEIEISKFMMVHVERYYKLLSIIHKLLPNAKTVILGFDIALVAGRGMRSSPHIVMTEDTRFDIDAIKKPLHNDDIWDWSINFLEDAINHNVTEQKYRFKVTKMVEAKTVGPLRFPEIYRISTLTFPLPRSALSIKSLILSMSPETVYNDCLSSPSIDVRDLASFYLMAIEKDINLEGGSDTLFPVGKKPWNMPRVYMTLLNMVSSPLHRRLRVPDIEEIRPGYECLLRGLDHVAQKYDNKKTMKWAGDFKYRRLSSSVHDSLSQIMRDHSQRFWSTHRM